MEIAPTVPRKPTADRPNDAKKSASGFAGLAERISGWTSRLLVSLIVIVAGVGFGRQVLLWWSPATPPSSSALPRLSAGSSPFQPQSLRFGNQPWEIQTQALRGDKRAASVALVANCRKIADKPDAEGVVPDESERTLLQSLARGTPAEEKPGNWQIYATEEVFPMAVGVRLGGEHPPKQGEKLAETGFSVLTWGMAVPSGAEAWMLYTFRPKPVASGTAVGLSGVPLPPGSKSTLTLQSGDGGAIAAIEGDGELADWKRFYDQHFAGSGWKRIGDWQGSQNAMHARFVSGGPEKTDAIDVRIGYGQHGRLSGLLTLTPSINEAPTRERP